MPDPRRSLRPLLWLLLALDAAFAVALVRLPARLVLPARPTHLVDTAPTFTAVTAESALFVLDSANAGSTSALVRVPLDASGAARAEPLNGEFLLDAVHARDAAASSGARWAWNGRVLLLAGASRPLGPQQIHIALVGPRGLVVPPRDIDGVHPSAGWTGDHFEVAFVTPAPAPQVGRVRQVLEVDERGSVSTPRVISQPGDTLGPVAWPGGVRTPSPGAPSGEIALPDGTHVSLLRNGRGRVRPVFVLAPNGSVSVEQPRTVVVAGSALAGDYTVRREFPGGLSVQAHLGERVARPRYLVRRGAQSSVFETDVDARGADLLAIERQGVLHLVDPRGFHVRLRAADLSPLDARASRVAYLIGVLGAGTLAAVLLALAMAHALALLVQRVASGASDLTRFARLAGLTALFLAGAAVFIVWSAG